MTSSSLNAQETEIKFNVVRTLLSSLPAVTADRFMLDMLKTHHPEWASMINAAHELLDSSVHSGEEYKTGEEETGSLSSSCFDDFISSLEEDDRNILRYHFDKILVRMHQKLKQSC